MLMLFVNDIHSRPPCLNSNLEETLSDVAFASVYTEKTRLKKCLIMIIIIIMIKSQETMIFWRAPKIDFLYETEARKRDARLSNLMLYTGKSS